MPRSKPTDHGTPSRHRWVVDRLGEQTAGVEHDGDHVYDVPRMLVPEAAREGDVLAIEVGGKADALTIRVKRDTAATKRAKDESAQQLRAAKGEGGRGDIEL
jgi:hypothetical protein